MKKVILAAVLIGALTGGSAACIPAFAAAKKPIAIVINGSPNASVTHSYSARIATGKPISGMTCTVLIDGKIKTQTVSLNSSGKASFTVKNSYLKTQYQQGHTAAVLTAACSSAKYVGTSLPHLLTFVK